MSVVYDLGFRLRSALESSPLGAAFQPFAGAVSGRARVIAVAAQKGGVGKTTTAVHLAAGLAQRHGMRVLLIDLDAQGHVASSLRAHIRMSADASVTQVLLGQVPDLLAAVVPTTLDGLHVTTADKGLAGAEAQLAARIGRETLLARALRPVRAVYDAIVLDCPPNLGLLTLNALCAADEVLVPCDLSVLALEGVDDLVRTLDHLASGLGHAPHLLGLVHTRVDRRNPRQNAAIRRAVQQRYAGLPLQSEIATNTAVPTAQLHGQVVYAHAPDSPGARDYSALSDEVHRRVFARR
ncbi:MAG: ParA family protein [Myxococcales bacterium]|nr:ParA family protein [Myxococcales bacterium]